MGTEYIRTVLVQIAVDRIDGASTPQGLLADLEEHRSFVERQRGFQGMRVTRSTNHDGNVLLVVQTRWQDESSLAEYSRQEPNVTSIINKHRDLTVAGSLQVSDVEWPGAAARPPQTEVNDRLLLPLLVPLGAFVFAVLAIYGLSRIYLEVPSEVATPLALGIAVGILAVSWYLASNPYVPRWQVGSIVVATAALLLGGGVFAAVHGRDAGTEVSPSPAPGASPVPGGSPAAGGITNIAMIPTNEFDRTELVITASEEVAIEADNRDGRVPHNFAVYASREAAESGEAALGATAICSAPCNDTVTLDLAPGEYFFRCDIHPVQMTGTLVVQEESGEASPVAPEEARGAIAFGRQAPAHRSDRAFTAMAGGAP